MTVQKAKAVLARDFRIASLQAVDHLLAKGMKIAQERSSGSMSYAEMAQRDHPYASRHPQIMAQDRNRINIHQGAFYRGWFKDHLRTSFDIGGAIVNDTEVADYLQQGTDFMHPRDIQGDIEERLARHLPEAEKILTHNLERGRT